MTAPTAHHFDALLPCPECGHGRALRITREWAYHEARIIDGRWHVRCHYMFHSPVAHPLLGADDAEGAVTRWNQWVLEHRREAERQGALALESAAAHPALDDRDGFDIGGGA